MTLLEQVYYDRMFAYLAVLTGGDLQASSRMILDMYQAIADYEAALSGATDAAIKLNLGSADVLLDGFVNVDVVAAPGVQEADLTETWPWQDSSVDYVRASHVIEHLPDKIFTMNELWRVLRPGAKADITVPTTEGPGAWQDPTHVSFWNRRSFLYYEAGSPYRELSARQYGVEAAFRTVRESQLVTVDGPFLSVTLQAVKP
jgi:SAM-dependent methyltransferase